MEDEHYNKVVEDEHYNKFVEDEHYSDALYVFKKPEYHKAHLRHNGICSLKSSMLRVSAERIKHTNTGRNVL